MRALIQRVREASVAVDGVTVTRIGPGLLVLAHALGKSVGTGVFGADMQVALVNDGPVTIWLDSRDS